jgi:hypothetical protein
MGVECIRCHCFGCLRVERSRGGGTEWHDPETLPSQTRKELVDGTQQNFVPHLQRLRALDSRVRCLKELTAPDGSRVPIEPAFDSLSPVNGGFGSIRSLAVRDRDCTGYETDRQHDDRGAPSP